MRILHVNEYPAAVGGAEKMLFGTCELQQARGHQVALLYADDVPPVAHPFPTFRLPRSGGFRDARDLSPVVQRVLDEFRPDVVHLHNTLHFLSPFVVSWFDERVPTTQYVHDARLFCPRGQTKILARTGTACRHAMGLPCAIHCFPIEVAPGLRLSWRQAALRVVALRVVRKLAAIMMGSRYMFDELSRNGFDADRLHILPGFTDKCPDPPVMATGHDEIVAVGRFDGVKGMEDLVAILARLRCPHWRATLVGDGPFLPQSRDLAGHLGIADRVRFAGHLPPAELDRCYERAALVIVPSRIPEAFGLIGIEAMAFGKPVVAFDRGGIRDWLEHGRTGYIVPPGNADTMARHVDRLLDDRPLAMRLGHAGRARVDREFRPDRHLDRLLEIYERIRAARHA